MVAYGEEEEQVEELLDSKKISGLRKKNPHQM
jgi:hypothetical protein